MNELTGSTDFRDNELGREDDFRKSFGTSAGYVGKDYGGKATEVLSMGLQELYKDAARFASLDREYVAFVLGQLDGSLRARGGGP